MLVDYRSATPYLTQLFSFTNVLHSCVKKHNVRRRFLSSQYILYYTIPPTPRSMHKKTQNNAVVDRHRRIWRRLTHPRSKCVGSRILESAVQL